MKKSFGFFGFGTGKKNLYLGFAFLLIVGLLSLLVFSGAREGFATDAAVALAAAAKIDALTTSQIATLTTSQIATLTTSPSGGKCTSTTTNSSSVASSCSEYKNNSNCAAATGCKWVSSS